MTISRHIPAPTELTRQLHYKLSEAGQAVSDEDMKTFFLACKEDDGTLSAGCKGEIAFRHAHISELWVAQRNRGKGLGRKLLSEAEHLAREHGCSHVHLETRNPKAKALYEKLGYRIFGELENYEEDLPFSYLVKSLDKR